jgi:hypothetical protein
MPRDQTPRAVMEQRTEYVMQLMDSGIWNRSAEIALAEKWKVTRNQVRKVAAVASRLRIMLQKRLEDPKVARYEIGATAQAIRNCAFNEGNPTTTITVKTDRWEDEKGIPHVETVESKSTKTNRAYQAAIQANDQLAKLYNVYAATEVKLTIESQIPTIIAVIRKRCGDAAAELVIQDLLEANLFGERETADVAAPELSEPEGDGDGSG